MSHIWFRAGNLTLTNCELIIIANLINYFTLPCVGPLSLDNVIQEKKSGLASCFNIECHYCGGINYLNTSVAH